MHVKASGRHAALLGSFLRTLKLLVGPPHGCVRLCRPQRTRLARETVQWILSSAIDQGIPYELPHASYSTLGNLSKVFELALIACLQATAEFPKV